jgi:hypothetical protein
MAFEDITTEQAKLITEIIERLATGESKSDLPSFGGFGGLTLSIGEDKKQVLRGFGETDLIILEQTGYIVFSQKRKYDPCRSSEPQFKIGLTPKAYQQFQLYKTPEANAAITSISDEISRLLALLNSDWIQNVIGYYCDHRPDFPYTRIDDEYKVQDLIYCLVSSVVPDLQFENPQPKSIGAITYTRVDFSSEKLQLFLETKFVSSKSDAKTAENGMSEDIFKYGRKGSFNTLIFYVYCDNYALPNPREFERGLTGKKTIDGNEFQTYCIVKP